MTLLFTFLIHTLDSLILLKYPLDLLILLNDEVERNLSSNCTDLCYILEYIYNVLISKRCISLMFAFNMQIPDLCLFAFRYIFQYVTQNSTFTRQNMLSFIILKLIPMYTLVLELH